MPYRDSSGRFIPAYQHEHNESNRRAHAKLGSKITSLLMLERVAQNEYERLKTNSNKLARHANDAAMKLLFS